MFYLFFYIILHCKILYNLIINFIERIFSHVTYRNVKYVEFIYKKKFQHCLKEKVIKRKNQSEFIDESHEKKNCMKLICV